MAFGFGSSRQYKPFAERKAEARALQQEQRLNDAINRVESAQRQALRAEQLGDTATAMHFIEIGLEAESEAF